VHSDSQDLTGVPNDNGFWRAKEGKHFWICVKMNNLSRGWGQGVFSIDQAALLQLKEHQARLEESGLLASNERRKKPCHKPCAAR
jgi:hypothetical protein